MTPDLRENAVHPIPTIAVLSLIDCSAMFYPALCVALLSFRAQREIQDASALTRDDDTSPTEKNFVYRISVGKISFNSFESSSKFSAHAGSTGTIWAPLTFMLSS